MDYVLQVSVVYHSYYAFLLCYLTLHYTTLHYTIVGMNTYPVLSILLRDLGATQAVPFHSIVPCYITACLILLCYSVL